MRNQNKIFIILGIAEALILLIIAGAFVNKFIIHKDDPGDQYQSVVPEAKDDYIDPQVAAEGVQQILDGGSDGPMEIESTPEETTDGDSEEPVTIEVIEFSDKVNAKLEAMTLEDKIYQMFVITPKALTGVADATMTGDATKAAYKTTPVGGMIYSDQNFETDMQVKIMVRDIQAVSVEATGTELLIFADKDNSAKIADVLKQIQTDSGNPAPKLDDLEIADLSDVTAENVDAAIKAINRGAHILYGCEDYKEAAEAIKAAVEDGTIEEETINQAVGRILTAKGI